MKERLTNRLRCCQVPAPLSAAARVRTVPTHPKNNLRRQPLGASAHCRPPVLTNYHLARACGSRPSAISQYHDATLQIRAPCHQPGRLITDRCPSHSPLPPTPDRLRPYRPSLRSSTPADRRLLFALLCQDRVQSVTTCSIFPTSNTHPLPPSLSPRALPVASSHAIPTQVPDEAIIAVLPPPPFCIPVWSPA
ncbi:hypothetical protein LZ31DRAFT_104541 [Colletotrichum somersetense]|nr:hypothetical protein LZ31DRAFT_104541 [Colletotrichum somersetense]